VGRCQPECRGSADLQANTELEQPSSGCWRSHRTQGLRRSAAGLRHCGPHPSGASGRLLILESSSSLELTASANLPVVRFLSDLESKMRCLCSPLLLTFFASAESLSLLGTWGSSMVLQNGVSNTIRGRDIPGAVVQVAYEGSTYSGTCDAAGNFGVALPPHPSSSTAISISVNSSSGSAAILLDDVVHGDVFVCSGQSNMQSSVGWQIDYANVLAAAAALGPVLRLFQVARLDAYGNTSSPQANLTASIPWSRASAVSAVDISALCYLFGVQAVTQHPDVPIGVIDSSWGGTAIQPWMSAAALAKCGPVAAAPPPSAAALLRAAAAAGASREDLALGALGAALLADEKARVAAGWAATPYLPSTLYNSMIAPLQALPIKGLFWYQVRTHPHPHPHPTPHPSPRRGVWPRSMAWVP
jgi:sialate O-acetylesterase